MFENQGHVMHMNMDNEFERILMEKDFRAREDHLLEYVDQLKEKNREQVQLQLWLPRCTPFLSQPELSIRALY